MVTTTLFYSLGVIQRNPAITVILIGFQKSPPGCTRPICLFHNGEDTPICVLTGLGFIDTGSFPNVQIRDGYPNQIRLKRLLLPLIQHLAGLIKHGVSSILIRTLLCISKAVERSLLRCRIRPGLTHTVPDFLLCSGIGYIVLCQFPAFNDGAEVLHIGGGGRIAAILDDLCRFLIICACVGDIGDLLPVLLKGQFLVGKLRRERIPYLAKFNQRTPEPNILLQERLIGGWNWCPSLPW